MPNHRELFCTSNEHTGDQFCRIIFSLSSPNNSRNEWETKLAIILVLLNIQNQTASYWSMRLTSIAEPVSAFFFVIAIIIISFQLVWFGNNARSTASKNKIVLIWLIDFLCCSPPVTKPLIRTHTAAAIWYAAQIHAVQSKTVRCNV